MEQNLNDETLAEFNTDGAGVTEPGEVKASVGSRVAITDTTKTTGTDSDDELDLLALGEYDTWVKTIENEEEQLNRIEEVAKDILVAESISRSDIERIFSELDNVDFTNQFTEGVSTVAGFTSSLTKTNLEETQLFFKKNITERKEKINSHYKAFLVEKMADVKASTDTVKTAAVKTSTRLNALMALAQAASTKARNSNNYLCYVAERCGDEGSENFKIEKKLTDLRNLPFNSWETGDIAEMLVGIPAAVISDFNHAYQAAKPFLNRFNSYKSIHRNQEANQVIQRDLAQMFREACPYEHTTYFTLLALFSSPVLGQSVEAMMTDIDIAFGTINEESEELGVQLSTALYNLYISGMFINAVDSLTMPAELAIIAFNDVL